MSENKTNPVLHAMPSLADVAFVLPLAYLFGGLSGVGSLIGDGDTGWHIRTGDWIRAHMQVPYQDLFSYTKPGAPWFAWEWLWDVMFSRIHQSWGLPGVVMVSLLVICTTSMLLYKLVLRVTAKEGLENPLVAIALTAMAMGGASLHWLARPHLFSTLFLILFLIILEKVGDSNTEVRGQGTEDSNTGVRGQGTGAGNAGARGQGTGASNIEARGQGTEVRERGIVGRGWPLASGLWPLLLLPLLTILWTNLHGGFFIGVIVVGAYAGGPLLRAAIEPDRGLRAMYAKSSLPYVATAAGCMLASLVNPYTYHLHEHIYKYLLDPFTMNYINEFQPTNFRWGSSQFLEVMLLLAVCTAIWYGRRKQFTEVLLVAGWGHLSLVVVRNVPIFMLVAAPLVARPLVHWIKALSEAPVAAWLRSVVGTFEEIGQELVPMERPWRIHAIPVLALVVIGLGMSAPQAAGSKFKAEYDPKRFPAAALPQLREPGHRIFTSDIWGGYLIYVLSPQGTKVYVDGRSDFYGDKFDNEYVALMGVKYDWEKTLAGYGVDTILLPADSPLAGAIKESRHWRVTYDDRQSLVFRLAHGAPGTESQVSASNSGGGRGRDLPVTAAAIVPPQEHAYKQKKERE